MTNAIRPGVMASLLAKGEAATEAQAASSRVQNWAAPAGLTLHPRKTRIADRNGADGFDFLGYHFQREPRRPQRFHRWPRKKSIQRLRDALRAQTPRVSGRSLRAIIASVKRTLCGWLEYFKHSNVATVFPGLDAWLRRRLRRTLLKRLKKHRHHGLGTAQQRWPNDSLPGKGHTA